MCHFFFSFENSLFSFLHLKFFSLSIFLQNKLLFFTLFLTVVCQAAEDYQQTNKESEDTKSSTSNGRVSVTSNNKGSSTSGNYQQNKRGVNDYELHLQGKELSRVNLKKKLTNCQQLSLSLTYFSLLFFFRSTSSEHCLRVNKQSQRIYPYHGHVSICNGR